MPDDSFLINGYLGLGLQNPTAAIHIEKPFTTTSLNSFVQLIGVKNTASDLLNQLTGLTFEQNNVTNTARGFIGIRSTGSNTTRADLIIASPNTSGDSTERIKIQSDGTINIGSSITIDSSTGNLTATTFTGNALTATSATNATNTVITDDITTNATMYVTWVTSTSGNLPQKVSSTKLTFNPSTGTLTATTFSGALSGNATSATNATNIGITDDTTTNATMYPVWVTTTSGNLPSKVSSTKLTFNPSTGTLTTTTFSGALSGNATTATTLQNTRTINGVNFNGSANIVVDPQVDQNTASATNYLTFVSSNASGYQRLRVDSNGLLYNPSNNSLSNISILTATNGLITDLSNVNSINFTSVNATTGSAGYSLGGQEIIITDFRTDTGNTSPIDYDLTSIFTTLADTLPGLGYTTGGFNGNMIMFRVEIVWGYYIYLGAQPNANATQTSVAGVWYIRPQESTTSAGVTTYSILQNGFRVDGAATALDTTPNIAIGTGTFAMRATTSQIAIRWTLGDRQAANRWHTWLARISMVAGF